MEMSEEAFECYMVSWEQAFKLARILARNVLNSGFLPDVVIGISRGGLVPARTVGDLLLIKELTSIKTEHWETAVKHGETRIKHSLPIEANISGKKILVVDDVADTGDSFWAIIQYLQERDPLEIKTAALHFKTSSTFTPDYWGEKLEDWLWIVYPWAVYEDFTVFIKKLLAQPMTDEQLRKGLACNFNIRISEKELNEILNDLQLSGKIKQLKKGKKILWEKIETQ